MAISSADGLSLDEAHDTQILRVSAAPPVDPVGAIVSRTSSALADRQEECRVDATVDITVYVTPGIFSSSTLDEVHQFDITPSAGQHCFWTLRLTV